jgi:suppressor for copper-sensitivity B
MQNIYLMLLAFFSGFVLNFMPCTLSVLSIKMLCIAKYSKKTKKEIRIAFFSLALGIIFSFLAFSLFIIIFKIFGRNIGWGFHFQNPYFLIFLILALVFFSCMVLGLCVVEIFPEIESLLTNKCSIKGRIYEKNFLGNFIGGIFAFIFATPCSVPILGSALSLSLMKGGFQILNIFFFMGTGMAFPFILMAIYTDIIKFFPKPGKWMITFKKIISLILFLTIIWLIYILYKLSGIKVAIFLSILSLIFFAQFTLKNKLLKIFIILSVFFIAFTVPMKFSDYKYKEQYINSVWKNFENKNIEKYIKEDKIVIIIVYADWCMICNYNNLAVFNAPKIIDRLKKNDIIAMKANFTRRDKNIEKYLKNENHLAIPYYIIYSKKFPSGYEFSGILNQEKFLRIIEMANN